MNITIPVMGFGRAGGFRVLSKLADYLIERGVGVSFLAPFDRATPYYPTNAYIEKVYYPFSKVRYAKVIFSFIAMSFALARNKSDFIFFSEHLLSYACFFNFRKRTKKVYYIQAYEVNLVHGKFFKIIAYLSYYFGHKKIVNSYGLLPEKFRYQGIVPAGVDIELFKKKENHLWGKTIPSVGIIGRVEPWKGTKEVVKVLERMVAEQVLNFKVNIAIHQPALSTNLAKLTSFHAIKNDAELAAFYQSNDILLAVGLIEDGAFHYPCAEGMATSLVVISNYSPLTKTDSEFAISTFDSEEIYEKLNLALSLSKDSFQQECLNNRKIIEREYSWDSIAEKLDIVLRKLN